MFSKKINYIVYCLLLVFTIFPLVGGLGYAILYSFGLTGALSKGFTFEHWGQLLVEGDLQFSIGYSITIALAALGIAVSLALFIALKMRLAFRSGPLSYLIYIPLAFPGVVAAFFFFQLLTASGILSRLLWQVGIIKNLSQFPGLVNDAYGVAIICSLAFLSFPFFLLLFNNLIVTEQLAGYEQLAATLGANKSGSLWRVSMPMILRRAIPNVVLYFIFMFGSFEIPLLLGRSNPEMISVLAVRKLQRFNLLDLPQGYAVAIVYSIFVLFLAVVLFKTQKLALDKA